MKAILVLAPALCALAAPVSPLFASQFDAEQWLGEHWRELAAQDVAVARLLHEGVPASAPVPLRVA